MTTSHDLKSAGLKATVPRLKIINLFETSTVRHLSAEELATLRLTVPDGKRVRVKEGAGCFECRGTGYFGRTGIFEILPVDDAIQELVVAGAGAAEIKREAVARGTRTLRQSALRKLAAGMTTFEEVVRVTGLV